MEESEATAARPISKTKTSTTEGKQTAIIAYITIIGLIIAFIMNNEKKHDFAAFHIRQSLGLCVTGLALGIAGMIPVVGSIINIVGVFVLLYMWIMGLVSAMNEKKKPIPFLGEKFEDWFKSV